MAAMRLNRRFYEEQDLPFADIPLTVVSHAE